ncbi:MAG: hypothetical protein AB7U20_04590 [Planctomycetaceae bacterium]
MTGYTVHTGSTEKFSNAWDRIFGSPKKKTAKQPAKTAPAKSKAAKARKKT